jgi:hypothetical protein
MSIMHCPSLLLLLFVAVVLHKPCNDYPSPSEKRSTTFMTDCRLVQGVGTTAKVSEYLSGWAVWGQLISFTPTGCQLRGVEQLLLQACTACGTSATALDCVGVHTLNLFFCALLHRWLACANKASR